MKTFLLALTAVGLYAHRANALSDESNNAGLLVTRGTVCGSRGFDNGVDSYKDSADGTLAGCSAFCSKQSKCKSFAFDEGECYLYNVPVAGNFDAEADSPFLFYDISCVGQTSTTNGPPATTTTSKTSALTTTTTTTKATTTTTATTKRSSSSAAVTSTTKVSTTLITTTTTTTTTSALFTPSSNSTCSIDSVGCTNNPGFTDPCNRGCGCTYLDSCGGYLVPGYFIGSFHGISYGACIVECDNRQPECIGITYQKNGECYLYNSTLGSDQNPTGWYARRTACANPCPHMA